MVDDAVGVLMLGYWLDEESPQELLDRWAQQQDVGSATIAAALLEAAHDGGRTADQLVRWVSDQLSALAAGSAFTCGGCGNGRR